MPDTLRGEFNSGCTTADGRREQPLLAVILQEANAQAQLLASYNRGGEAALLQVGEDGGADGSGKGFGRVDAGELGRQLVYRIHRNRSMRRPRSRPGFPF